MHLGLSRKQIFKFHGKYVPHFLDFRTHVVFFNCSFICANNFDYSFLKNKNRDMIEECK
jgi:hypothetical protein